jgi:uncharacterized protein YraI
VSIRISGIAFRLLILLSTGCASNFQGEMTPTQAHSIVTSTLPVTLRTAASATPLSSPAPPTIAPVDGVTSTQVNVRAEPSTTSLVLGVIPAETRIEIIGQDPGGDWWQINYPHPQAIEGKGWVTAQYITAATTPQVPVLGGSQENPGAAAVAVVQQQLNVRSGPGTGFNSLGTLNAQDVVRLTGKDSNGTWLQIDFPAGPEGKGWVSAAFVQPQGTENLPIVAESGQIVGTGTPTAVPPTPTATLVPAWEDQDSPSNPVASVLFEPAGTQTLIYNGDLSTPQGDSQDWIAFRPYDQFVFMRLQCNGSDAVQLEIVETTLRQNPYIKCGDPMKQIAVDPDTQYLVHIQAAPSAETLQYTNYILTIKTRP